MVNERSASKRERKKNNVERTVKAELLCPDITIEQSYPLLYLSTYSRRRRRRHRLLGSTRKLSVLLRIKISSKSYGRLQTNRAVAFPTGCRNFRRLSTFPTALAATSPILLPPTSFYAYPRPTATICKVKQSCFFIFSTLSHTRFFFITGSERINSTSVNS